MTERAREGRAKERGRDEGESKRREETDRQTDREQQSAPSAEPGRCDMERCEAMKRSRVTKMKSACVLVFH